MTVCDDRYMSLRDEFLSVAHSNVDNATLETLKEYYAETIGSTRKLSYITNIRNLVIILEKRDIVSHDKIEPFLYICNKYLDAIQLQSKLIAYNESLQGLQNRSLYNMYQRDFEQLKNNEKLIGPHKISDIPNYENSAQHSEQSTSSSTSDRDESTLKTTILLYISERLGRSWRDVARYLGLRECDITAIESHSPYDLKEQSYQALQKCFTQSTPMNWKLDLLQSLEKARRRDIKEVVEQMIFPLRSI